MKLEPPERTVERELSAVKTSTIDQLNAAYVSLKSLRPVTRSGERLVLRQRSSISRLFLVRPDREFGRAAVSLRCRPLDGDAAGVVTRPAENGRKEGKDETRGKERAKRKANGGTSREKRERENLGC